MRRSNSGSWKTKQRTPQIFGYLLTCGLLSVCLVSESVTPTCCVSSQDREGELALIDRLLAAPQLSSADFQEWKKAYQELFSQEPSSEPEEGPPLTPSLSHTHSYIETHV